MAQDGANTLTLFGPFVGQMLLPSSSLTEALGVGRADERASAIGSRSSDSPFSEPAVAHVTSSPRIAALDWDETPLVGVVLVDPVSGCQNAVKLWTY